MSRICLSTSDLFTLRVALGHAITANPAPSRDFPFPTESTEKLVALLDSLLLATAPGTTFAVEEAPNDQPYDAGADQSLRLADKVQQDLGVTNTGSGYLTEDTALASRVQHRLSSFTVSRLQSSLLTSSRGSTPDSDIWGSNASTFRESSPASSFGGESEQVGCRRASDLEWDDERAVGGRFRISKRPRLGAILEDEEDSPPSSRHQGSFRRSSRVPGSRLRSSEPSPLKQALLASANLDTDYPFSFTMNSADHPSSPSSPLPAAAPPTSSATSPTASLPEDRLANHSPHPPRLTIRVPPRAPAPAPVNQADQQLDDEGDAEPQLNNGDRNREGSVDSLFNWVHGGNPPVRNEENLRRAGNADWLGPGQVRPGVVVKPPKPICERGSKSFRVGAGRRRTAEERRRMDRMGAEGLGDLNEGDDAAAYQEDEERMTANPASSSHAPSTVPSDSGYLIHNGGESCSEIQSLNHRAGLFLSTLAAGCRECLPDSTTSTTMVANPIDVFRALNDGFMPGTLRSLTRAAYGSSAHHAQLCTSSFAPENGDPVLAHLPARSSGNPIIQTLSGVVTRMIDAEVLEAIAQVIYWVNAMHFAALIMRETHKTKRTLTELLKLVAEDMGRAGYAKVGYPLLRRYFHDGTVVALMAAAGSMYLVIVMACCRVRQDMRSISFKFFGRITRELRRPHPESLFFKKITNYIIPAIAHLMREEPLTMSRLASEAFMVEGGKIDVDCTDLRETDEFFQNFALMEYINDRDEDAWKEAMTPNLQGQQQRLEMVNSLLSQPIQASEPLQLPPILSKQLPETVLTQRLPPHPIPEELQSVDFSWNKAEFKADTHVVDTSFSPELNSGVPYKTSDEKARYNYTQRQRKATLGAIPALDVEQLRTLLERQLADGKRKNRDSWVEMDTEILNGGTLHINDMHGNRLVSFLEEIPKNHIDDFFNTLCIYFKDFRDTDTKKEGPNHKYPSAHVDVYGRYTNRGDGVPNSADPSSVQKEGKEFLNTCRNLPRTSAEWNKNSEIFQRMQEAAAPIFEWIRRKMEELFPENFKILSQYIERLPCNYLSPVHPFSGFVINLNCATRIHRDWGDSDICLVIAFSDVERRSDQVKGEDGALCFQELGLVCRLRPGVPVIFRSRQLSHFNRHFRGYRASLVLHTDSGLKGWADNMYGWKDNVHYRTKWSNT